jgi:methionyl-tRNA formyltransferase
VAATADRLGLPTRKPPTLRAPGEVDELARLTPDIVVVAAYGLILPPEMLTIPRFGCVNVHASILPRWRGAAPIQRAILAGDDITGASIMLMEEGLDTGPVCVKASTRIGTKTAPVLTAEVSVIGAAALMNALSQLEAGGCRWTPQDGEGVTYADKVIKADVTPEPWMSADEAVRRVRASMPGAPARVLVAGRGVTLLECRPDESETPSGVVEVGREGIVLGFGDGGVLVTRLKPDGKGEMDAAAWGRGLRLQQDDTWEAVQ